MTWDAIAAVSEAVGALGVIFSLLYLAIQIRRSTQVERVLSSQSMIENLNRGQLELRDTETASLVLRGLRSYRELHPEQKFVFAQIVSSIIARFSTTLEFEKNRMISPSYVEAHAAIVKSLFQSSGVREWWASTNQEFFNRELCDWIRENAEPRASEPADSAR